MQPFSKRNNIRREYSGFGEASIGLRNRLLLLYGMPYSGNEYHFGIGNDNWIHEVAFDKDLQMYFGKKMRIEDFRDPEKTNYNDLFDFIEIYYRRAESDIDSIKRRKLFSSISSAFINSGSVYEFGEEGTVLLKIDDISAKNITATNIILEPFEKAVNLYRDCIDGLITRSKQPKNVVGDMYVVFEEYLKNITKVSGVENWNKFLKDKFRFHPTQIAIINKLVAYRGDVWGPGHAGNGKEPDESDAVWFLESVITQIRYIDSKIVRS